METKIENGIEYRLENDIWYPSFKLKEEGINLGKYGLMRKNFLEEYHRCRFEVMLLTGELYTHCREVEEQAKVMEERLIKQYNAKGFNILSVPQIANEIIIKEIVFV